MKKKLFACLLLVFIVQASILIFATDVNAETNIILNAPKSSYDYFGDAYYIEMTDDTAQVEFENTVENGKYLSFYLFSPRKTNVFICLYSENDFGEEISVYMNKNTLLKVFVPFGSISSARGISIETEADFVVVCGLNVSDNTTSESGYKFELLDLSLNATVEDDSVSVDIKTRSIYPVKSIAVESTEEVTVDGNTIKALRKEQEYSVVIIVTDENDSAVRKTYVVPALEYADSDFEVKGGTFSGKKGSERFYGGGNKYITEFDSKSAYFKFCYFGEDLTVKVGDNVVSGFYSGITYDIIANSKVKFYSNGEFELIISGFESRETDCDIDFSVSYSFNQFKDFVFPWIDALDISEIGIYDLNVLHSEGELSVSYSFEGKDFQKDKLNGLKEGEYTVRYLLKNQDEETLFTYVYTLIDTVLPIINANISKTIELGTTIDLTDYTATDTSGCSVKVEIKYGSENILIDDLSSFCPKAGEYTVTYIATDFSKSANVMRKSYTVDVRDTTSPTLSDINCSSEVDVFGEIKPQFTVQDISEVTVETGYILDSIPYVFNESFTPIETGEYTIYVKCVDQYGNESKKEKIVSVLDKIAPVINKNAELKFDSEDFMSFSNITAEDNYDSFPNVSITAYYESENLEVNGNGIFYQGFGEYIINVVATDRSGNSSNARYVVNVKNEDETQEIPSGNIGEENENSDAENDTEVNPREEGVLGCNGCASMHFSDVILGMFFVVGIKLFRKK